MKTIEGALFACLLQVALNWQRADSELSAKWDSFIRIQINTFFQRNEKIDMAPFLRDYLFQLWTTSLQKWNVPYAVRSQCSWIKLLGRTNTSKSKLDKFDSLWLHLFNTRYSRVCILGTCAHNIWGEKRVKWERRKDNGGKKGRRIVRRLESIVTLRKYHRIGVYKYDRIEL